jgi:hypothetical protein
MSPRKRKKFKELTMLRKNAFVASLLALVVVGLLPASSSAQTGAIGGLVKDGTGAVLPGVVVEASSPALIERTRTADTDSRGVYRIVDLRPGIYDVTFTLPGFTKLRRDGVELSAGVTVSVDAELHVSAVEETVTVTGLSPLVDLQNATQHRTMTATVTSELPAARSFQILTVLIPGVTVSEHGREKY